MKQKVLRLLTLLATCAFYGATIHYARSHVRITTNITWAKDIRPIFRQKCMTCHHPGGLAPDYIDLTTYGLKQGKSGARDWAKAIEEMVLTRRMPPWKPDTRFGSFSNHRMLTQQEIELIVAWSRGGAPQGTPQDLPVPPEFTKREWSLGQPDLVVSMPEEHLISSKKQADQLTVKIPIELKEDRWVTGYEFFPGNPAVVHSIMAFIHDPEGLRRQSIQIEVQKKYDPLAKEDEAVVIRERSMPEGPHFLGQWVRGDTPVLLPDSAGRKLRKGSTIELQITYFKQGVDDSDREFRDHSRLGLYFAAEQVDLLVESKKLANEDFVIQAGQRNQEVQASVTFDENVHLIGINPHMGILGKDLEVRCTYPDGKALTLLWIPEYEHKWLSSYLFEKPIAVPAGTQIRLVGHYDNSANNANNLNRPPEDVRSGPGPYQERLLAWLDYMLDDHLIVTTAAPSPASITTQQVVGPGPAAKSAADRANAEKEDREIYWCPMRGVKGCGIKDYLEPGYCDVCKMKLVPRREILEKYKDQIAAMENRWTLTEAGREEIYWCPNRSRPDHSLMEYVAAGRCPICSEPLVHKARFTETRTWTCLTDSCPYKERIFYSPGRCPGCAEPVEAMGHMDHNPVHGGILFMADNKFHHLEGTHPAPDEFRMYFYDDYKKPLDPRNFAGRMITEEWDEKKGTYIEKEFPLGLEKEGDLWLTSRIPAPKKYPIQLIPRVWLAGEEKLFNFFFTGLTMEPEGKPEAKIRMHSHGDRPPVEVPETAADVIREILKRDRTIQERIEAKDWFGLHVPAFDTIDLAAALKLKMEGLNPRQRKNLGEILIAVSAAADRLDKAGDASDGARVQRYYEDFKKLLEELKQIFPEVAR